MNAQIQVLNIFPELFENRIVLFDEPMKEHCSFQIGGLAEVFCLPQSFYQIAVLVSFALKNKIPYTIIGKGSNLLISDKGIKGLVISTQNLDKITRYGTYLYAECGVTLKNLCIYAKDANLSGLEFASGIPGSLGGAVFMNAGAYEGEISMVLQNSICLEPTPIEGAFPLPLLRLSHADHRFSYRSSSIQDKGLIQLASVFRLKPDSAAAIIARMDDLNQQRESKQPLDLPSAGSVFKRPQGHFTGKLIDDCGLRGFSIGGAMISDKHCGFIVNIANATASDVLQLIRHVQETVWNRHQVRLETEIRFVGER